MEDAKSKFWGLPEVLEQFLPYNDVYTILSLTEVFPATLEALKGVKVWDNLIRRTSIPPPVLPQVGQWPEATFGDQMTKIFYLSKILSKIDKPEKKKELMLDLLHVIAKNYPAGGGRYSVKLSCPCSEIHEVSDSGFLFLEEVESSIGTAEQHVEEINSWTPCTPFLPIFPALSSRAQRQERMIRVWNMTSLPCTSLDDAITASTLMEHSERIIWAEPLGVGGVAIQGDIGVEGLTALATALQRHPGFSFFVTSRRMTRAAPREALKMIWDAMGTLGTPSTWIVADDDFLPRIPINKNGMTKEANEIIWEEEIQIGILDMSDAQFLAAVEKESIKPAWQLLVEEVEAEVSGSGDSDESDEEGEEEEDQEQ